MKTLLRTLGVEQQAAAAGAGAVAAVPSEGTTYTLDEQDQMREAGRARLERERRQAEQAGLEQEEREREYPATKARVEQEERERLAAERERLEQEQKKADEQARLEQEQQEAAKQARLEEERRLSAEKAQLEEQERERKADEEKARLFLSKKWMIGLAVGVVVLLLVWILWPRGSNNQPSPPQTAGQQPLQQTTAQQTQPQAAVQQPQSTQPHPQTNEQKPQTAGQQPQQQTTARQTQPQAAVQQHPQTNEQQPQSAGQQPQPPAADGKKPVAKNCPEGVYCDPDTNLTWTIEDNGKDVSWEEADQYCKNLTLAGLSGWELPPIEELEKLYDPQNSNAYKIRKPFRLTRAWAWSSNMQGSGSAWYFDFSYGWRGRYPMAYSNVNRALCVRRSGK